MALSGRQGTAALFIFLVVSTHPIEAHRHFREARTVSALSADQAEAEAMLAQLQQVVASDEAEKSRASSSKAKVRGRRRTSGWYCNKLQRDYERRAGKLERALKEGHELPGGVKSMSWTKQGYAALKSRTVVNTLRSGQYWECEWALQDEADKSSLKSILSIAGAESPCVAKAGQILKDMESLPQEKQQQALGEALSMMMADPKTCTPPKSAGDDANKDEKVLVKEVDNEAAELEAQLQEVTSLAQVADHGLQSVQQRAAFAEYFAIFLMGAMAVIVVLLMIIACMATLMVATLIVGFVWCILRSLLYGLISVFKTMGEYSFGGCVKSLWRWVLPLQQTDEDTAKPGGGSRLFGVGCAAASIAVATGAITLPVAIPFVR